MSVMIHIWKKYKKKEKEETFFQKKQKCKNWKKPNEKCEERTIEKKKRKEMNEKWKNQKR